VTAAFVPVTNITGVPNVTTVGEYLTLNGTVAPTNATNRAITWSVQNADTTGTVINGDILSATAPGTATIRATITNGLTESSDYTQNFSVRVRNAAEALAEEITGYNNGLTATATGNTVTITGTVNPGSANLILDTSSMVSIVWNAKYSGASAGSLITVTGGGEFSVGDGAQIVNSAPGGKAISSDGNITVSGGTVSADGENGTAIETAGSVEIGGGVITANGPNGKATNAGGNATLNGGAVSAAGVGGAAIIAGGESSFNSGIKIDGSAGVVKGSVTLRENFSIPSNVTLVVTGATLTNNGVLTNNGTIDNKNGGVITNSSIGTLTGGGTILNSGGTIDNYGLIEGSGSIENQGGTVNNHTEGTIDIDVNGDPVNSDDTGDTDGGGTSGCSAGFGAGLMIALSGMLLLRKRAR
jgi:hypothetical protein